MITLPVFNISFLGNIQKMKNDNNVNVVKKDGAKLKTLEKDVFQKGEAVSNKTVTNPIKPTKTPIKTPQFGYDDAINKLKKVYGTDDVATIVKAVTANEKNLIGEGCSKKVYKMDGIEDYVLAVKKGENAGPMPEKFAPRKLNLPKFNFGEAITEYDNASVCILGKVNGESHSIPDWIEYHSRPDGLTKEITEKEAKTALSKLSEIAKFPQSSFDYLADEFKYLSENKIRMDVINPNNVLCDSKNKRISLIDVLDAPKDFENVQGPLNGPSDMIAVMLDSLSHVKYLDKLNEQDKKAFMNSSREIIKKCKIAANNTGFEGSADFTRNTFKLVSKWFTFDTLERYDSFVNLYKDVL